MNLGKTFLTLIVSIIVSLSVVNCTNKPSHTVGEENAKEYLCEEIEHELKKILSYRDSLRIVNVDEFEIERIMVTISPIIGNMPKIREYYWDIDMEDNKCIIDLSALLQTYTDCVKNLYEANKESKNIESKSYVLNYIGEEVENSYWRVKKIIVKLDNAN